MIECQDTLHKCSKGPLITNHPQLNNKVWAGISLAVIICLPHTALALDVPLKLDNKNWQSLTYKNIKANTVSQTEDGIHIAINSSASPLIYVFDTPQTIQNVTVLGKMGKLPVIPEGVVQGELGADDFPFRLGLVMAGDKTLNFAEKLIAPQWVKTLYSLAPKGAGVDHIHFLNLANAGGTLNWQQRNHPRSKGLFKETIIKQIASQTPFDLSYALPQSAKILALWISADGDDTQSSYELTLNSISLN